MKKNFLRYFLNLEYAIASAIVLVMIAALGVISDSLPETDETSFLNPIFDRIDFLNIEDISLDAIFAIKDMSFSDERIVILNIRDVAPVPDGKLAALLYKLNGYGAKAVGIDVFFDEQHVGLFPEERSGEIDSLARALRDNRNVVLADGFDPETLSMSIDLDPRIASLRPMTGFANMIRDNDDVVRRFWPYRTIDGERRLSFSMQLLRQYDSALVVPLLESPEEPQIIHYSGTYLPRFGGREYQQFIPLSIDDVLDAPPLPAVKAMYRKMMNGAIVLVGYANDEGFAFLSDTHETPLGRKVGLKGPDMSGLLIHANIIDMVLKNRFIRSATPAVDWLIPFALSYLSIALYRVLRTKTNSRLGLAALIFTTLIIETIIVFFLPIIVFFLIDVKIAYDLSATAVLLFIPASALTTMLRFELLKARASLLARRTGHEPAAPRFADSGNPHPPAAAGLLSAARAVLPPRRAGHPVTKRLQEAFSDDEAVPAHLRLLHSALSLLHFAFAIRMAERLRSGAAPVSGWENSGVDAWRGCIPEIAGCFSGPEGGAVERRYYLKFLQGRKDQFLRESSIRDLLFLTQLPRFNEFFYFEEWEILLPHVLRMHTRTLRPYLEGRLMTAASGGNGRALLHSYPDGKPAHIQDDLILNTGDLYFFRDGADNEPLGLFPFCIAAECKLHRRKELFIFSARVLRQFSLPAIPAYLGETMACEAVLESRVTAELDRLSRLPADDVPRDNEARK